jgi:hypothetical protein
VIALSLCPNAEPPDGICEDPLCPACKEVRDKLPLGRKLARDPGIWLLHNGSGMEPGVQVILLSLDGRILNLQVASEVPPNVIPEDAEACGPYSAEAGGSVSVQRERLDALLELEREVAAILINSPYAVRSHEGGGPENIAASLALTVLKMQMALERTQPPVKIPAVIHIVKPDGSPVNKPRPLIDCPRCGAQPPIAHELGGGAGFEGIRTCGQCHGSWDGDNGADWERIHYYAQSSKS